MGKISNTLYHFGTIALIGHPRQEAALSTHYQIYHWLIDNGFDALIEESLADKVLIRTANYCSLEMIGKKADLAIVIGGDGNLLRAARILAHYDIKIIGVNRGTLGFLTDIGPDDVISHLKPILLGEYTQENRFLLDVSVVNPKPPKSPPKETKAPYLSDNKDIGTNPVLRHFPKYCQALNEMVLHSKQIAHMIGFEVYIDDEFAFSHKADGLIIATPTGSTAYSLSAGGPILTPGLNALVLVPMFPHRLTARPLVVSADSQIRLKFSQIKNELEVNCDSYQELSVKEGEEVLIQKSRLFLQLIHPKDYSYFNTLSSKLNWAK
ncbi:NAD(+)/NADH kinase [Thorsellia kenyensis]|uniref:NAD kinase n=1 Tax=Thorsellia kenyensis TaxID=1549888 RepID=A0ABV6CBI4_9GAMM